MGRVCRIGMVRNVGTSETHVSRVRAHKESGRPSFGVEKATGRQQITITGNPATATIDKVWKYQKKLKEI